MKRVLGFVKGFPLTSYGLISVAITVFTYFQKDYADSVPLMLLALPVFMIYGKICDLICSHTLSNYADIFLMFIPTLTTLILLDLLLFHLTPKLLAIFKSKLTKN